MSLMVSKIGSIVKSTGLYKEATGIRDSIVAGKRYARMYDKKAIHGLTKGAKKVYKKVGTLPVITGAAAFAGVPLPGASTAGIVAGIYLKKGLRALLKLLKR